VCVGQVFVEFGKADTADLGYWLLAEGRHLGYATRGVRLVSTWALTTLSVARVPLWTEPENSASPACCRTKRLRPRRRASILWSTPRWAALRCRLLLAPSKRCDVGHGNGTSSLRAGCRRGAEKRHAGTCVRPELSRRCLGRPLPARRRR
jgi:hypothetical protein